MRDLTLRHKTSHESIDFGIDFATINPLTGMLKLQFTSAEYVEAQDHETVIEKLEASELIVHNELFYLMTVKDIELNAYEYGTLNWTATIAYGEKA